MSKPEFERLWPKLKPVTLAAGEVLWETDEKRRYVYFPTTALICLLYETEHGSTAEVGIVGRQGLVGMSVLLSDAMMSNRAVVQTSGEAFRIKTKDAKEEFLRCTDFQEIVLRYIQSLVTQISHTAVCNRLHTVEQQLCRWLLVSHDHQQSKPFEMTQDQIANILGVRRETVSLAAANLQANGLIEYSRGTIKMLNRNGLEDAVCQCYRVVVDEYDRLLSNYKPPKRDT